MLLSDKTMIFASCHIQIEWQIRHIVSEICVDLCWIKLAWTIQLVAALKNESYSIGVAEVVCSWITKSAKWVMMTQTRESRLNSQFVCSRFANVPHANDPHDISEAYASIQPDPTPREPHVDMKRTMARIYAGTSQSVRFYCILRRGGFRSLFIISEINM